MSMPHRYRSSFGCPGRAHRKLTILAAFGIATCAYGAELADGDWRLSWDTTLAYGLQFRVQDRDPSLIARSSGGEAFSSNVDDGNLNYNEGLSSNVVRLTSEIELQHKDWFGAFVRGRAFYDFENENSPRARSNLVPLSDAALDRVGSRAELLDAFVWFSWDIGRAPFELRIGDQVLSWGESTFIPGGINTINPVDVTQLRSPGSELREAFLPEGLAWLSFGATDNTDFEFYYQYDWDDTELDPAGSFFSTGDFVGDGGDKVQLGFGDVSDLGTTLPPSLGGFNPDFLAVTRGPDREPEDGGQYGAAVRLFSPRLGDSELGFYFINYHSRIPVLNGITGTAAAVAMADFLFGALAPTVGPATAAAVALDAYSSTATYFVDYPEDIKLYGFSFNTSVGQSALQGEISRRKDVPLQVDDVELLFAALSPVNFNMAFRDNQLGTFGPSQEITGFIRRETTQAQFTLTRVIGPLFGADTSVIVGEAAWLGVHGMPSRDTLRLEGPGTFTSGNPDQATPPGVLFPLGGAHAGKAAEPASAFPDASSWGYRLAGRLEYNNAIGPVNLLPRFSWQHDVDGVSPGPGGPFREDRKALTLGVSGTYQNRWEADVSWTGFFGADRHNLVNDRDFVSATVKYSF